MLDSSFQFGCVVGVKASKVNTGVNRSCCALPIFVLFVLILHVLVTQSEARTLAGEDHAQEVIGVTDSSYVYFMNRSGLFELMGMIFHSAQRVFRFFWTCRRSVWIREGLLGICDLTTVGTDGTMDGIVEDGKITEVERAGTGVKAEAGTIGHRGLEEMTGPEVEAAVAAGGNCSSQFREIVFRVHRY